VIQCGANLASETVAVGDDVQVIAVGGVCGSAVTTAVSAGVNATIDSVSNKICGVGGAPAFCTTANSRINGKVNSNFATPYSGAPFVVDGGLSTLDKCESGSIQYEFTRCNTNTIGAACDAPANGTIIQGFSSDGQITAFPTANTRYRLRIRCSSQSGIPGCGAGATASTDALVNVYPADDGGIINMTVTCTEASTGSATVCDATDPLSFTFSKPNQVGNLSGFGLYRATEASLTSTDSPIVDSFTCLVGNFGSGAAPATPVVQAETPVVAPASRAANVYVIGHRQLVAVGSTPAGTQRITVTGSGTNGPSVPRFVSPVCP
jgi:hypothetical protein